MKYIGDDNKQLHGCEIAPNARPVYEAQKMGGYDEISTHLGPIENGVNAFIRVALSPFAQRSGCGLLGLCLRDGACSIAQS